MDSFDGNSETLARVRGKERYGCATNAALTCDKSHITAAAIPELDDQ